ncbi:hypothetical protein ACN6AT_01120 [Streptomyces sp. JL4002]|uniref:hypothetical protein n=1 Tax=Streptomyces TaxID=1883 RepID=UPI000A69D07D
MSLLTWEYEGDLFCALTTETGTTENRTTHYELSEARAIPAGTPSAPTLPTPGPTAVTVLVHPPAENKPPEVYFDATQTLPFAVLQHFVTLVASRLESTEP